MACSDDVSGLLWFDSFAVLVPRGEASMYLLVSNDTNRFLAFSFVNEAILLEIQNDTGKFIAMTPMILFLSSPLLVAFSASPSWIFCGYLAFRDPLRFASSALVAMCRLGMRR